MYRSYWGLRESPFRGSLVMQLFQQSPTHEEALARLHFLVDNHLRLGLLMGPSGSGKSLVMEAFAAQMQRRGLPVVKINLLGLEPSEMLWNMAADLKLNPDTSASTACLWRMTVDRLTEFRYQHLATVVLLDDADSANQQVLAQVARLARYDCSPESHMTLVLAGQSEKMKHIGDKLLELVQLRIDLEPWNPSDMEHYLKSSLAEAGSKAPVFSQSAIDRLHELTP